MKKVFAFTAFALILAACSNVAKFKPQIEELSSKWDSATSSVTEFATTVKTTQADWMNSMNQMQVAPEAMAKWDEATKNTYNEIQASAQSTSASMAGVVSEVDNFIAQWQEKSKEMQGMNEGLTSGKLEGDVEAKLSDLTSAVNNASSTLEGWKTKFEEVKTNAEKSKQMFADFMSTTSGTGGKTGTK